MKTRSVLQILREMLFANLRNKGMALGLAVLVWWFAFSHTEDHENLALAVRIETRNPASLVVVKETVEDAQSQASIGTPFEGVVQLRIKGQKRVLDEIVESKLQHEGVFTVDKSGTVILSSAAAYRFPKGIEVLSAEPSRVKVDLEEVVQEQRLVKLELTGQPKAPYTKYAVLPVVTPAVVEIVGPKSRLAAIKEIKTETLNLANREGPRIEADVPLKPLAAEDVRLAAGMPRHVKVLIELEENVEQREYEVNLFFLVAAEYTLRVTDLTKSKIKFRGTREGLDDLKTRIDDGKVFGMVRVPIASIQPGASQFGYLDFEELIFPRKSLPEGVEVVGSDPPRISYHYFLNRDSE